MSIRLLTAVLTVVMTASAQAADVAWLRKMNQKIPASETKVRLFNGQTLDGWQGQKEKYWTVDGGTIILGDDVRISRVAMTQGNLTLRVEEAPLVVQPNPFAEGQTVVIPRTDASIEEDPGTGLAIVDDSVSLPEVVAGLNALGVSARDMIDILKSIKAAGALHAEFVVQ